jgi:hypothetical protein
MKLLNWNMRIVCVVILLQLAFLGHLNWRINKTSEMCEFHATQRLANALNEALNMTPMHKVGEMVCYVRRGEIKKDQIFHILYTAVPDGNGHIVLRYVYQLPMTLENTWPDEVINLTESEIVKCPCQGMPK